MGISYTSQEFDVFTTLLIKLIEDNGPMGRFSLTAEIGKTARHLYEQDSDKYPSVRVGALKTYVDEMIDSGMLTSRDGKYTIS